VSADRIGIELLGDRVRAVALRRFGRTIVATADVAWDPTSPADAVIELVARLGRGRRVLLAVGLPFLHVARVSLPPLGAPDRRRALALDAARHFPTDGPLAVALLGDVPADGSPEPAFAVAEPMLERWLAAFAALGPVDGVEAAPTALARALGTTAPDATYELSAAPDEVGMAELRGGRVIAVRRAPRAVLGPDVALRPLPRLSGVPAEQVVAWGAALGAGASPDVQLLGVEAARALGGRRARQVASAAVVCGAALGLALAGIAGARARLRTRLDTELAAIAPRAAAADSLRSRLMVLDGAAREANRLAADRASALGTIAALGSRLPSGAVIQGLRVHGDEWQVDGTARSAAAVVPALDADPRFTGVRSAAPSTRFTGAGPTRESFSVAFRVRGAKP
jgi:hypothetical protein